MKRKGWESLSPAYRKRLERNGITASAYAQGASLQKARGHRTTPEHGGWKKKAVKEGISFIIPEYHELPRAEQERLGRLWVKGFMSRGEGEIANPKRRKGERIQRRASVEQIIARMDFIEWMDENEGGLTAERWTDFREAYKASFSA